MGVGRAPNMTTKMQAYLVSRVGTICTTRQFWHVAWSIPPWPVRRLVVDLSKTLLYAMFLAHWCWKRFWVFSNYRLTGVSNTLLHACFWASACCLKGDFVRPWLVADCQKTVIYAMFLLLLHAEKGPVLLTLLAFIPPPRVSVCFW